MTLSFQRLLDQGTQERLLGPVGASILFQVPGPTESVALSHPSLPAPGTVHPDGISLYAGLRYARQAIGSGTDSGWIVEVEYVPFGAVTTPSVPPDVLNDAYYSAEINTSEAVFKVPVLTRRTFKAWNGTTIIDQSEWVNNPQDYYLPITRLVVTVNIQGGGSLGVIDTVQAQTGKVHFFGGRNWLYEGCNSFVQNVNQWRFQHTWVHDPGNDAPPIAPLTAGGGVVISIPARAGFSKYAIGYLGDGSPFIGVLNWRTYIDAGYLTLPGNLGTILV